MNPRIAELLNALDHPALPGIELGLERVEALLAELGNPQQKLPPVVHVAGTNGKGSLLAYLTAIFQQAGLKVHRYTSPHLIDFSERILLAGNPIADEALEEVLTKVKKAVEKCPATSFEATTAAAFLAFAEIPADVLLLETGMGGRLDATNVVEKPVLTAITPIGYDHMHFLGETLAEIATEKAGILKEGVPCVVSAQPLEAMEAIEKVAAQKQVPLFVCERNWRLNEGYYQSTDMQAVVYPALVGEHQYYNAALAAACCNLLAAQFNLLPRHIEQGIATAQWPGRLQRLTSGALVKNLPKSMSVWLDGGHNPHAAQVLGSWMETRHPRKLAIICGMLNTKDATGFLKVLSTHLDGGVAVAIPDEPISYSLDEMWQKMQQVGIHTTKAESLQQALADLAEKFGANACDVLICGSLSLASAVLRQNT